MELNQNNKITWKSKTKRSSFLQKITRSIIITAGFLGVNLSEGQAQINTSNDQENNKINWEQKKVDNHKTTKTTYLLDNLDHNSIVHMNVEDILIIYWEENWLEIIRKHFLEEINKYRKLNNRPLLDLDSNLNEAAQRFAEYWEKYKKLWHSFDGKTFLDMWVDLSDFSEFGENVAYWQKTIYDIVDAWYNRSPWHKKTMLGLNKTSNDKDMIYTHIGIGIKWLFVVLDFGTYDPL